MKIRWGSLRDREIARDVKVLAGVGLLVLFVTAAPDGLGWPVLVLLAVGGLTALLMCLRQRRDASSSEPGEAVPHRGINMSRIPLAGFPGLVFAIGFVWMFWFGAPELRPIVVGASIVGCLVGAVLIILGRRHRLPPSTPLGLSGTDDASHDPKEAPPSSGAQK